MRLLLTLMLLVVSSVAMAETVIKEVIQTDRRSPYKVSFDVVLKKRIKEPELEVIARAIKDQNAGYERVFIGYFIAGTNRDSGYWGTSHWEGDTVRLVPGPSEADIEKWRSAAGPSVPEGAKVLGRWFIPGGSGGHVVIYEQGGKTFVHQRFHDGSGTPSVVVTRKHKAGTAYNEANTYDYFVVTNDGNLELWDNSGPLGHDASVKTEK
jgi:hypothetical protein